MRLFGRSEKELEEFVKELEIREIAINKRNSDVLQLEENLRYQRGLLEAEKFAFQQERNKHIENVKRHGVQVASEQQELERRRQEVIRQEAVAKTGFALVQNEQFRSIIEKRLSALDVRQTELDEYEHNLTERHDKIMKKETERLDKITKKEGEIAKRELEVTEREQKANAGFADRLTALAHEAKQQHEANLKEAELLQQREEKIAQRQAEQEQIKELLRQREEKVAAAECERDAGYAEARAALDKEINQKKVTWHNEEQQARLALQTQLTEAKTVGLSALEQELTKLREERLNVITEAENKERQRLVENAKKEVDSIRKERDSIRKEIDSIKKDAEQQVENMISEHKRECSEWTEQRTREQEDLKREREANLKKEGELSAKEDALMGKEKELEMREHYLEVQTNHLDETVEERVEERKKSFDVAYATITEENKHLRDSLKNQTELLGDFETLKKLLGNEDPAVILRDLTSKTEELKRLREELATRPTEEMRERYDALEREVEERKAKNEELNQQLGEWRQMVENSGELQRLNNELVANNSSLARKADMFEAEANQAHEELKRLRSAYERPAEVVARYNEIEMPRISADEFPPPEHQKKESGSQTKGADRIDEIKWLDKIYNECNKYGIHFSKRILKAFHTAVKTAELSPITILAGVSGTGKSELPRLYSHFGGLLFEPLSVQPNWDSQESMLGFFNSIDNKFDAQPVLRFLAQSQQPSNLSYDKRRARWEKMAGSQFRLDPEKNEKDKELVEQLQKFVYPGTEDCMGMVLLDEMNLAHPELYFAEFLSKLELRRGKDRGDLPFLPVKIGAGLPPYELPLGDNILWVGTMNQDETTKSLSDKVLDRSIIIYFPRPTHLVRRKKLMPLKDANRELIYKGDFQQWWTRESNFTEEQIAPYKHFIEKMNDFLGIAGRAIGHRVWQSVEFYMANYPDVRAALRNDGDPEAAMHIAFEDQLVQKVMPKLRGIDTRGKSKTDCLDKIQGQLNRGINNKPFNLNEDFTLACELGYGQFMWQSANYLNEDNEEADRATIHGSDTEQEETYRGEVDDRIKTEVVLEDVVKAPQEQNALEANDEPPEWFKAGCPDRIERWLSHSKKERLAMITNHAKQVSK